ncbi:MAG: hypothetical protein JWM27_3375 [Gemmatimonadetes bacterium]|nr:hypothetical protein [Gemmatimonadota bacterium]
MRIATALLPLAAVLAAACVHQPNRELGPDLRDDGQIVRPVAQDIPLFNMRGPRGCQYWTAGDVVAGSLSGLREQAYQKMADAVVQVHEQITPTPQLRSPTGTVRPAASIAYVGTAVRFKDAHACAVALQQAAAR